MRTFYVYILSSRSRTLYIGVTNDLIRRLAEHRKGRLGFTAKYRVTRLVYFEVGSDPLAAIAREKQIKAYARHKKLDLITSINPGWDDLSETFR